jgi:hypothetical protein
MNQKKITIADTKTETKNKNKQVKKPKPKPKPKPNREKIDTMERIFLTSNIVAPVYREMAYRTGSKNCERNRTTVIAFVILNGRGKLIIENGSNLTIKQSMN